MKHWKIQKSFIAIIAICLTLTGCSNKTQGTAFSYDGQELQLRLANGEYVKLQDGNCDEGFDGCIIHKFQGTIANDQFYLVDVRYYEGGQHELYSYKTGAKTVIYGEPHLSPQGKMIAIAMGDELTGPNGVLLFSIAGGEAKELFRYNPEGYALYRFDRWAANEDEVFIELTTQCVENGKSESLVMPVKLINSASGWQLDQGMGAACILSNRQR